MATKRAALKKRVPRSPAMARKICDLVAAGNTLRSIAGKNDIMSEAGIRFWLGEDLEFAAQYEAARTMRADARADRIDEIARKTLAGLYDPQAARVAIDAEKWQAGKEQPKRYGDRLQVDATVDLRKIPDEELDAKIARLQAALSKP